MEDIVNML